MIIFTSVTKILIMLFKVDILKFWVREKVILILYLVYLNLIPIYYGYLI